MDALDVTKIRHDFPVLARMVNGKRLVYLDSASTSQKPMVMIRRMQEIYTQEYARPEEGHPLSREATRDQVARLINADSPREIVFTRGATEALDQALDHAGIAVRSGKLAAQPYLKALGVEEAVRASFMFMTPSRRPTSSPRPCARSSDERTHRLRQPGVALSR